MSKWFASAQDLSESDSSDSSDDDKKSTPQVAKAAPAKSTTGLTSAKEQRSKFMSKFGESSESEEEQRVVKTGQDKKKEALNQIYSDLKNHSKINDFGSLLTDFERLTEEIDKSLNAAGGIVEIEAGDVLPLTVVRALVKIEDCINEAVQTSKDKKSSLSKQNSVSLNKLKQKLKKYLSTTGPADNNFEKQVLKFREKPVWSEDERAAAAQAQQKKKPAAPAKKKVESSSEESESEESESSDDDEEEKKKPAAKKPAAKKPASSEDEESEEEESEEEESEVESEEESSEEEEINIFNMPREQLTPAQRRLKWVKFERLPLYLQELQSKKKKKEKDTKGKDEEPEDGKKPITPVVVPGEKEDKETVLNLKNDFLIDYSKTENVHNKLKEIQEEQLRGKKHAQHHATLLAFILEKASDPRQRVDLYLNLLNSIFTSAKTSTPMGFLTRDSWVGAVKYVKDLLTLLNEPSIKAIIAAQQAGKVQVAEDGTSNLIDIEKSIIPSFISFLQKLDSELLKAFQNIGHTKFEYLQRIRDESKLLFLCDDVQAFVNLYYPGENSNISRIALLKLDHLYYKNDTLYSQFKTNSSTGEPSYIPSKDSRALIEDLVRIVNNQSSSKMKVRAALMQAYHHGLHRRFYEGKELLLKTHVGESIHLQDIGNQILYNRAVTQIGMAAFRLGLIEECHEVLVDIQPAPRLREILAQGVSRQPDKPVELEKEEQRRQIPYHMHINLQLLECIYMITAMLLEIPNIAENQFTVNKRVISRSFKKLIEIYDAKAFQLAAENYRDNIVYAAKQLNKSNWKQALDYIFAIKMLAKMHEFQDDTFRTTLITRVKECALRAFLCRSSRTYDSFSMQTLTSLFELSRPQLHQLLNRLIIRGKLQAHFDASSEYLVMDAERGVQNNEAKELQQLSLQYAEKLEMMIETNEKLIDMVAGGNLYSTYAKEKQEKAEKIQVAKEAAQAAATTNNGDNDFQMTQGPGAQRSGGRGGAQKKHDGGGRGGSHNKRGGRGGTEWRDGGQ